jgi:plastocyanin
MAFAVGSMAVVASCYGWWDDGYYYYDYCYYYPHDCHCDPYHPCYCDPHTHYCSYGYPTGAPPQQDAYVDGQIGTDAADASAQHVVIVGGASTTFNPAVTSIRVGDTVTWIWAGDGHSVTSGAPGVADGRFCAPSDANCGAPVLDNTGATYSHTFTQVGSYPYFCAAHYPMGMIGRVDVTP